jgi:gas vesicle protein
MENKFRKGLILGGLLAVGAAVGFAMTKDGKKLTKELQKDLKPLAKHLKSNLHKMEDVTKDGFDQLVITLVDEYSRKKQLAGDAKDALITSLQSKWHEMEEAYIEEKDEMMKKII